MRNELIIALFFLFITKINAQTDKTFYVAKIDIYVTLNQKEINEKLSDVNEVSAYFPLSCLYYHVHDDNLLVSDERTEVGSLTNNMAVLMIAEYKGQTESYVSNSIFASYFVGYVHKRCLKEDLICSEQVFLQSFFSKENLFSISKRGKVKNFKKGKLRKEGKSKYRLTYNGHDPNFGKYKEEFLVSVQKVHHIKKVSSEFPCY
ncbi:hypothetical protein [Flammeovirga aprica]|uniref:Uncharacterized protein n=1 Tax=Flammeovirga aprica JL-4 TaxID=694437 RepID=A0A7X9RYR5_9BACT|nr:hypothetical protein [Flammeovirga aprica]NME71267.1 hypothetical protein [Flammeovirga aprica JL-4]